MGLVAGVILVRDQSHFFSRCSVVNSGLSNLMMISLSLLTAVLGEEDIGGVGERDGGPPDLTFSAQVGLLAEDCVTV